jgi:hypothetical protein
MTQPSTLRRCALLPALLLAGCAASTGIVPYAPGVFLVSDMRAPVLGGAAEAQRVALLEANGFCAQQGLAFMPDAMGPGGYPYSDYGPTNFTARFRCLNPSDPLIARFHADMARSSQQP